MKNNKLILISAVLLGLSATGLQAEEGASEEAKRTGAEIAQTCASCHGENGISQAPDQFPHLAGQYKNYLVQALKDYKSGERENQIMKSMAANLSTADMEAVAEYYAKQEGLIVPPREPATSN